jgi:hypothetical protein
MRQRTDPKETVNPDALVLGILLSRSSLSSLAGEIEVGSKQHPQSKRKSLSLQVDCPGA